MNLLVSTFCTGRGGGHNIVLSEFSCPYPCIHPLFLFRPWAARGQIFE